MKKENILSIVLLIAGVFFSQAVFAQGISVGLSPLSFELTGNQGDIIENYVKIGNPDKDNVVTIKMVVEDIAPTGEQGHVTVEPADTQSYSLASWIKCEPEEFTLQPGAQQTVKFTITVPNNAEPGGHYGTVVAGATAVAGPATTGATIVPRVGTLILLTVPGEAKESLSIKEFSVDRDYFDQGPVSFTVKFENSGTVHLKPTASITIADLWGRKVKEIPLTQKNVLPGGVRTFEAVWNQKWLLGGKYVATLSGTYGRKNISLTSEVITFWAFPWKVALGILLALIFFILTRKRWLTAFKVLLKGEKK
ncbi:MAG: hypothetical protein ABH919_00615 [bacterium]